MFRRLKSPPRAICEARWTVLQSRRLPGVSPRLHAWLSDRGSLTRSVTANCQRRFAVDLVRQAHGTALPTEARLLGSRCPQSMVVREVRLDCGRESWVFARTLIPLHGLRGAVLGLTKLGHRPLGEVLFSDPTTRRLRVEVARILPRHHLFAGATAHLRRPPAELWGRRTLFEYGDHPILVNELFLPAVPALTRR